MKGLLARVAIYGSIALILGFLGFLSLPALILLTVSLAIWTSVSALLYQLLRSRRETVSTALGSGIAPPGKKQRVPLTWNPRVVGALLVIGGIAGYFAFTNWVAIPVNVPIARLNAGGVTKAKFRVLMDSYYDVGIEFDRMTTDSDPNCVAFGSWQRPSALTGYWAVYRDGLKLDEASPSGFHSYLEIEPGSYEAQFTAVTDGTCLAKYGPRLIFRINRVDRILPEWFAWQLLAFSASGLVIIALALAQRRHLSQITVGPTGERHVGPLISNPTRKFPLREKFSGIPAYGFVGSIVFLCLLITTWILSSYQPISYGIYVFLDTTHFTEAINDKSAPPIIVRVERCHDELCFFLQGTAISQEDLKPALKRELSRRSEWTVFIEADFDLPFQAVALATDIANSLHAKSVLLTPLSKKQATAKSSPPPH